MAVALKRLLGKIMRAALLVPRGLFALVFLPRDEESRRGLTALAAFVFGVCLLLALILTVSGAWS